MARSTLTPEHAKLLERQGITPKWAIEAGVFSAVTASDLPEDLADFNWAVPGIVYPLKHLDGTVTHQLRQDNPGLDENGKPKAKYLQPKNSGTVIAIPKTLDDLSDDTAMDSAQTVKTLLVVEGTKQTLAAAEALRDDPTTWVVGIQGCSGWRQDNFIHEDLVKVVEALGARGAIEILFDQDVASNPDVWRAADALKEVLTVACNVRVDRVKFIHMNLLSGDTSGLDDFLGKLPKGKRPAAMAQLRKKARKLCKPPKAVEAQKAKANADSQWEVRMDGAEIVSIKRVPGFDGEERTVVKQELGAAAVFRRVAQTMNEDTGEITEKTLILDVALPTPEGKVHVHRGLEIPDSKLADVNGWLAKIGGPLSSTVARDYKPQPEIANAIRTMSQRAEVITRIPRFGWYLHEGEWVFLSPGASISKDGARFEIVAWPSQKDLRQIPAADISNPETVRHGAGEMLRLQNCFNEPHQWLIGLAALGLAALPVTPMASLGYFGLRSSGKSTIVQGLTTTINPAWAPPGPPMNTFNGSIAALDLMSKGLNNMIVHYDDLKPEASRQKAEQAMEALDAALRRSYGSPGKARGTFDQNSGTVGLDATDAATPLAVVTGESVPSGGQIADSGLDRLIAVQTFPGKTFRPTPLSEFDNDWRNDEGMAALNDFENTCASGILQVAYTAYRRELAQQINMATASDGSEIPVERRLDAYTRKVNQARREMEATIHTKYGAVLSTGRVSSRARTSIASLLIGLRTILRFIETQGQINASDSAVLQNNFANYLVNLVSNNTQIFLGGNTPEAEQMLDEIRSLISVGDATFDRAESDRKKVIGSIGVLSDGTEVINLAHKNVANSFKDIGTTRKIIETLSPIALTNPEGGPTRRARVGGSNVRVLTIPMSLWDSEYTSGESGKTNQTDTPTPNVM